MIAFLNENTTSLPTEKIHMDLKELGTIVAACVNDWYQVIIP